MMNSRLYFFRWVLLSFLSIFLIQCGSTPSGTLDGTWRITNITCNGQAGNSSASTNITSPRSQSMIFTGTTGQLSYTLSPTCTYTVNLILTFPTTNTVTMTTTGNYTCSSTTACAAAGSPTCDTPAGTTTYKYSYGFSGISTMTLTSTPGFDSTCTSAVPPQSDPVGYTLTR